MTDSMMYLAKVIKMALKAEYVEIHNTRCAKEHRCSTRWKKRMKQFNRSVTRFGNSIKDGQNSRRNSCFTPQGYADERGSN